MEAHVEACPDCQNVLERLAADSSACQDREPEGLPPREQPPMIPGFVIERALGRGGEWDEAYALVLMNGCNGESRTGSPIYPT